MSERTPKPSAPLNPDAAIGGSGDVDQARWVKAPDPAWTFRRKGLLPLTALVSLVLYGVTAFATRTERRGLDEVRLALHGEGLTWVQAHAAGQRVVLRGSPPNDGAAKAAKDVVASTRCDTWLGALPCVSSVDVRFEASAAPASDVVANTLGALLGAASFREGVDVIGGALSVAECLGNTSDDVIRVVCPYTSIRA